jgi:hypothetical protein
VLAYLRALPYRNALPLSNVSQLHARCDVLVAEEHGRVLGVASTYHDLPLPNMTFAADHADVAGELLHALVEQVARLRDTSILTLLPAERRYQLARYARILEVEIEYQMVVEPEALRLIEGPPARRLTTADVEHLDALAQAAGLSVWHSSALALGPAFGRHPRRCRDRPYRDPPRPSAAGLRLGLHGRAGAGGV